MQKGYGYQKKNNDQMNESFGAHRSSCMEKRL